MSKKRKKTGRREKPGGKLPEQSAVPRSDAPRESEPGSKSEEVSTDSFSEAKTIPDIDALGTAETILDMEALAAAETEPDADSEPRPAEQGDLFDSAPATEKPIEEDAAVSGTDARDRETLDRSVAGEDDKPSPRDFGRADPEPAREPAAEKPPSRDFGPTSRAQLLSSAPTLPVEYVPLPGRRSFGRILWSVILGALNLVVTTLLVFGLVGAASYLILKHYVTGKEVKVPTIVDISLEDALVKLDDPGLLVKLKRREFSEDVQAGHVVAQFPMPGVTVKAGTPVQVVISRGAARKRAPSVIGMSEINAGVALRAVEGADLDVAERAEVYSAEVKKSIVVAQDPPPGTPMPRGGGINLLTSKGPAPVYYEMPDLRDRTLPEARIALGALRLVITEPIREADHPGTRRGFVIAQRPRPGQRVARGDRISVTIASGLAGPNPP